MDFVKHPHFKNNAGKLEMAQRRPTSITEGQEYASLSCEILVFYNLACQRRLREDLITVYKYLDGN